MKKLITAFIVIIGLWSANAQVNIDRVNAPKNPLGPYWAELKNSEAKGDVYSIDHVVFPRDGKLVYTQSKNTYEQALKDKTSYTEIKNGLIVKQKSNFDDLANLYDYDANKNIIREENSFWIYTYKYDAKNRLIEKIATSQKETKTERETYSYESLNGELIVNTSYYGKDKNTVGKSHYKNGLEILNIYENDTLKTEYTFDEKGNWIKKTTYDPRWGNNTLERSIIYYNDLDFGIKNKQFNWERVPFTQGSTIGFPVIIYNDRKAPNFWLGTKKFNPSKTIDNSALFYLELGDRYYYGKDAFRSKEDIGLKGIATEVSVGSEALLESKNKYVKMHDKGKSFFKFSDYLADKSYYIADSLGTTHYIINNFDANSERQFYPATKYTDTHMFYTIEAEKNSYQLFENGKRLDYTGITRWQFTETGDQVVQYKGKPYMVLVGSNKNKTRGFYPAKAYNGEKIFDNDPTNPNDTGNMKLEVFNAALPLKAMKIGEFAYRFFQNNLQIENPKCAARVIEDKEMLFSYGYEDFIITNNPSSVIGTQVDVQKVARENEVIVMYINGKVGYFYNSCEVITKENYKIALINDTQWLVYFSALGKSIIIDISKPVTARFVPYYTYSTNDWLYKTPNGGVKLFSQGQGYSPNNFTVKLQGADAFVYVNGRLSFYLANYNSASANKMLALTPY